MADKLKMQTNDVIEENITYIQQRWPNVVKEFRNEDGKLVKAIDFELLGQELSKNIISNKQERFQMVWPDKKKAVLASNSSIKGTLRPILEKSLDFNNTQNIYIEGDNLDVLKLLRETYLNKIKMIYIDPPYNTGNDFVYNDDFSETADEYFTRSGQYDDQGNKLITNTESNGRFHTDWLNMIYPRLKVARDLLKDDGVIFISIDENEVHNLRKICDEIYGEDNFISQLGWQKVYAPKNQARYFSNDYEFILCYCKDIEVFSVNSLPRTEEMNARYKNPDNDPRGDWKPGDCVGSGVRKNGYYDVISPKTGKVFNVPQGKHWVYAPDNMQKMIDDNRIWFGKDGNSFPAVKQFLSDVSGRKASSLLLFEDYGHTDMAKKDLIKLFSDLEKVPFDTPKPVKLIKMLSILGSNNDDIILDFFSGSATTAQSLFELNDESGSKRKFILVQIPEKLEDNDGANDKGLFTLCDVGEERIRRAGIKIKTENPLTTENLDIGFRVLKLDSSNMKDVYYNPKLTDQDGLFASVDNVKEDRTSLDLLFQVMLELGIELSAKISEKEIDGKQVFVINNSYLVACFAAEITENVIKECAKINPIYVVFRDNSFAKDSDNINCEQIIKTISPSTELKVI